MKLQPCIEQFPDDVRFLYTLVRGWRTVSIINQSKTLAPPHILLQNVIPNTNTVVSTNIKNNYINNTNARHFCQLAISLETSRSISMNWMNKNVQHCWPMFNGQCWNICYWPIKTFSLIQFWLIWDYWHDFNSGVPPISA